MDNTVPAPVVYEVNIDVHPKIYEPYMAWLRPHIRQMYENIEGLHDCRLSHRERVPPLADFKGHDGDDTEQTWFSLTASYYIIKGKPALDDYLTHRAAAMRGDAEKHFDFRYLRFSRRIHETVEIVAPVLLPQ